eukprot:TRINITY_DN17189_c0_g1_i1.p1 TRINITY_DN17189_c0_g1~~TRINITY_DN17189_c0_g1_i1.p1  ORF type:complete len:226 (+),score=51.61 TRINITY_DN17189_c0_g1_i1:73-750(+)
MAAVPAFVRPSRLSVASQILASTDGVDKIAAVLSHTGKSIGAAVELEEPEAADAYRALSATLVKGRGVMHLGQWTRSLQGASGAVGGFLDRPNGARALGAGSSVLKVVGDVADDLSFLGNQTTLLSGGDGPAAKFGRLGARACVAARAADAFILASGCRMTPSHNIDLARAVLDCVTAAGDTGWFPDEFPSEGTAGLAGLGSAALWLYQQNKKLTEPPEEAEDEE